MKKTIAMMLALCLVLTMLCGMAFADGGYQVQVVDAEGYPVQGVMVQFCSDVQCMMGKTGEDGIAAFDAPAGNYTIHLLKVPEGYEKDSREYVAPETPALMTLTLNQEGRPAQTVAAKSNGAKDDAAKTDDSAYTIDEPVLGLHYVTPKQLRNLQGRLVWGADFVDTGALNLTLGYYAVSNENWDAYLDYYSEFIDAYMNGREPSDAPDPSWMSGFENVLAYDLYILDGGRGEKELRELLFAAYGIQEEFIADVTDIGADGDNRFFLVRYAMTPEDMDDYRTVIGPFFDELETLLNDPEPFLSGLTLSAPQWPKELKPGDTIAFQTADLAGNPIDTADLFAEAKVTVINCWATWCGPCKNELPELGEMAKAFEAQGGRIVGLCMDAADDSVAAEAESILRQAGADYLNLRADDAIDQMLQLQGYPTTFFVDSEGRILVASILGADPDGYRAAFAEALAQVS